MSQDARNSRGRLIRVYFYHQYLICDYIAKCPLELNLCKMQLFPSLNFTGAYGHNQTCAALNGVSSEANICSLDRFCDISKELPRSHAISAKSNEPLTKSNRSQCHAALQLRNAMRRQEFGIPICDNKFPHQHSVLIKTPPREWYPDFSIWRYCNYGSFLSELAKNPPLND